MMHKYAAAQSYAAYLRELGRFSNSNGGTTYDASTSKIIFTFGGTSNFIHETTHGTQFETNDIAFDAQNGSTLAADVFDEIEAYKAQYAYKPKSVSKLESNSTINSVNDITSSWVQGLAGGTLYGPGGTANTGIIPLNVNSTKSDFIRAYPQKNATLQSLPSDFILKSSYPSIYYKR